MLKTTFCNQHNFGMYVMVLSKLSFRLTDSFKRILFLQEHKALMTFLSQIFDKDKPALRQVRFVSDKSAGVTIREDIRRQL